ncbi:hypothetical protein, partial [Xanthomonas fragariae]
LDAGDEMVILEYRAAVTDGTWRLKGIFQGRLERPFGTAHDNFLVQRACVSIKSAALGPIPPAWTDLA